MIYISRIKLKSFKSFKKLDISIPKGAVSCFIGPNGSGKSNICDALRFGLGEKSLRSLRVKKVMDLIHYGSKSASVSITFKGDKNFEIKRIIRSDGKVLYKINDKKTTRKTIISELRKYGIDITTAHNIIAQNQVEGVIQKTPKELRQIIDSVSGIAEFDEKKKEALAELDKVHMKIKDARILMGDREGRLEELKKQKEQAIKYTNALELFEKSKATILNLEIKKLEFEFNEISKEFSLLSSEREQAQQKINQLNNQIMELDPRIKEIDEKINQGSGKNSILEQIRNLELQIKSYEVKSEELDKHIQRLKDEKQELSIQLKESKQKIKDISTQIKPLENELNNINQLIQQKFGGVVEEPDELKNLRLEFSKLEKKVSETEISLVKENMQIEKIEELIQSKEQEIKRMNMDSITLKINTLEREIKEMEKELLTVDSDRKELISSEKSANQRIVELDKKVLSLKEKIAILRPQVSISSTNPAISFLMNIKSKLPGIYGTVKDLISFDSKYATAIEACAGNRLFYMVVKDTDTALKAIDLLKRNRIGRTVFIPLDRPLTPISQHVNSLLNKPGIKGYISEFVKYDTKFSPMINYVFSDTLLADSADSAKTIKKGIARIVTLEGEVFERSGVIAGGNLKSSLAKRMELEKAMREHDEFKSQRSQIYQKLTDLRETILNLRKRKFELELSIKSKKEELFQLKSKTKEGGVVSKIQQEINNLKSSLSSSNKSKQILENQLKKDKQLLEQIRLKIFDMESQSKSKFGKIEEEKKQIMLKRSELDSEIKAKKKEIEILSSQILNIESTISNKQSNIQKANDEKIELLNSIKRDKESYEKLLKEEKKLSSKFQRLLKEKNELNSKISNFSKEIGSIRQRLVPVEKKLTNLEIKKATIQNRLVDKKSEYEDFKDKELLQGSLEEMWSIYKQNKAIVDELQSSINLQAPKQFEEMQKDIGGLKARIDQLNSEREDVLNLIQEIESKKKDIFMKTFYAVSENFKKIFANIGVFTGEGYLLLEKPSNPFEGGLQIVLKRQGKVENLESLSGGQKTMLALIFVFALAMFKPSPFYILDEADASLDGDNTIKVALFLKRMSKNAQFITITHNPIMMSNVDVAFGVTKSNSESTVVGVNLLLKEKQA